MHKAGGSLGYMGPHPLAIQGRDPVLNKEQFLYDWGRASERGKGPVQPLLLEQASALLFLSYFRPANLDYC